MKRTLTSGQVGRLHKILKLYYLLKILKLEKNQPSTFDNIASVEKILAEPVRLLETLHRLTTKSSLFDGYYNVQVELHSF
jgi:hypothetical protein